MARRSGKKRAGPRREKAAQNLPFHNPFLAQAKELRDLVDQPAEKKEPPKPERESDEEIFLKTVGPVTPLEASNEVAERRTRPGPPPLPDEEFEVLTQMADLVSGALPLDVRDTDEYVQGARPELDPQILERLSAGLIPSQDHLDLHGLALAQARENLADFLQRSRRTGLRCVLIIHGRGLRSPQGQPVLKPHVVAWLSRSALRKHVLAFATARPYDGGAGALYVLLKG